MSNSGFGLVAGRYTLRDSLGVGGMGRVWLAYDEILGREVAIKEVSPRQELSAEESDELCRLILREARATARINHAHVVRIYDVVQTEEWPWIVMEYIPSLSLRKVVAHEGPLPPGEVAVIGLALLEALCAADAAGVLHRDVKPDNVLIGEDGRVVLTDFGLASVDTDGAVTSAARLGTPQYVAPERARHGVSTLESDLWSLGATLYAAVEGRSPYQRATVMETLTALAVDPPDPMQRAGPLAPVLFGLLRREPSQRLTPPQIEAALRSIVEGRPERVPRKPKRTAALAGLLAAGLLAIGAVVAGEPVSPIEAVVVPPPERIGVMACENPPAETTTVPSHEAPAGAYALPAGWVWVRDGYAVAVPAHWRHWTVDGAACFADPSSSRLLAVGIGPLDPPGYAVQRQGDIQLAAPAFETEFTYAGEERKRRAIALFAGAHVVLWASDEFDFQPSRSLYDVVRGTYHEYTSTS